MTRNGQDVPGTSYTRARSMANSPTPMPTVPGSLAARADATIAPSMHVRRPSAWALLGAILESSKPGITRLVTITALVGFAMAAATRVWTITDLLVSAIGCALGTAMSAAGANALNQWMEKDRDALMHRTNRRPIPAGRASARAIILAGTSLIVGGFGVLWIANGLVPALVALACAASYLIAYTPLKPLTTMATYVGAIPGALPPLIGWTAATADHSFVAQVDALIHPGGLVLFAIMFAWQIPHFLAIAWMHREDYARGGYRVLAVVDPTGTTTSIVVALWTLALLALTVAPAWAMPESLGAPYVVAAMASGLAFTYLAGRLVFERTRNAARRVFFASIAHLPLIFLVMVIEAFVRAWVR